MKAVIVTWHDAHADGAWIGRTEIDNDPYVVRSIGWLLEDCKDGHVTIAQSEGCADTWDHVLHVPMSMIVEIEHLPTLFARRLR